jgi:hypothetical protein
MNSNSSSNKFRPDCSFILQQRVRARGRENITYAMTANYNTNKNGNATKLDVSIRYLDHISMIVLSSQLWTFCFFSINSHVTILVSLWPRKPSFGK